MVGGGLLACLPRQIIPTKKYIGPFKDLFLLKCFGDNALNCVNLRLICHSLCVWVIHGPLKDSIAPVHDAKDAGVGFALEGWRCPVSAEFNRTSESVFGFVTSRVQWREVQMFAWLLNMCSTEATVSTQVAHGLSLLVEVVESCGVALIICVSEVEGTVNHDLLTPRKERKLAFFIEREVLKRGDHPFR